MQNKKPGQATPRQLDALELRKAGLSYAKIGEKLGIQVAGAQALVSRALRALVQELGEDVIRIERERLDAMHAATWTKVEAGDLDAIDRCLKIAERRAKLEGLDKARDTAMVVMPVDMPDVSKLTAEEMRTHFRLMAKAARTDSDRERYEAAAAAIEPRGDGECIGS